MKNLKFSMLDLRKEYPEYLTNHTAKMQLRLLEYGKNATPRSWFYETKNPRTILTDVQDMLSKGNYPGKKVILEWETSKIEKFAPQGGVAPFSLRQESFQEYFEEHGKPRVFDSPFWAEAKLLAKNYLGVGKVTLYPAPAKMVIREGLSTDKYNTNSGYPLFIKRKRAEAISNALNSYPDSIRLRYPITAGSRASMGKTGAKARFIFMSSMPVNLQGQRFTKPLHDYVINRSEFFLPWRGWDSVQAQLNHWLTDYKGNARHGLAEYLLFGTDYTKMDQHFNIFHGMEVYDVINELFPHKFRGELKDTIRYVFTVPVVTCWGVVKQKYHNLVSGSEWTNDIETLFDFILNCFFEVLSMRGIINFRIAHAMGIGDDQLYLIRPNTRHRFRLGDKGSIVKEVVRIFESVGMEANAEKQEVSFDTTTFLQRLINFDGQNWQIGIYPLTRNLTSQVYPEFYHNSEHWSKYTFALRVLMICENCKEHPMFREYATYCYYSNDACKEFMLDKVRREEAVHNSRYIPNLLATFTGSDTTAQLYQKGIESFETYIIWKECVDQVR